jgi:hypothetical protein
LITNPEEKKRKEKKRKDFAGSDDKASMIRGVGYEDARLGFGFRIYPADKGYQ